MTANKRRPTDSGKSQTRKRSNLTERVFTGLIGAAVVVAAVVFSEWTFFAVFLGICILSLLEFYRLAGLDGLLPLKSYGTFCGIAIFTITFFIESDRLDASFYSLLFPLVSFVYMIKLYKKFERKPFTNIAYTFLGIFYVSVPFSLMSAIAFNQGVYRYEIILGCLLILWASDTGAYFAGTFFGRNKLFERISPKKSWEGFFGGALLALVIALILATYFPVLDRIQWIVVSFIIIVGGTFGDLTESLLKRSIEIKGSGASLPGHGGFLDRFDGLLLSSPFILAFLELFVGNVT
ncbi:MAG: phosphatidate cytidylyltransferase [Cyclobacteriaceae bacterium]|nr:phosphatidate cytidylyltransferase [Cyclobacteriaceae bacterium]